MQELIAKYHKIMEKPIPEPFHGYMTELLEALEGKTDGRSKQQKGRGVQNHFTESALTIEGDK